MTVHYNHSDFLQKAVSIVEAQLGNERFGVSELARELGMSRSNLHRWVKSVTGKSASQFIREIRLKKAFELLKDTSYTVSEVAFQVGFGSSTYFSKCFHEYYGYTPGEVGEHMDDDQASPDSILKTGPIARGKKRLKSQILISVVTLVAFAIILVVIFKPVSFQSEPLENTIAVLPFWNDSPDKENESIIDGMMNAITRNLQSIKELKVLGRTSVETYRNNPKPITEIARELGVNYLIEGSGQKYGKSFKLSVGLLEGATGVRLWEEEYDKEINEPEDYFRIQSQIAMSIADALQAIISPKEKQLIEKIPTTNLTAYDFYLRGEEELWKYWLDKQNINALERAKGCYNDALKYDSTYAKAYCGLAIVYLYMYYWETLFTERFGDSVLILANKALEYDMQLADAYRTKGIFYYITDQPYRAIKELDIATDLNPNENRAYRWKGWVLNKLKEYDSSIENFHKAASLSTGQWLISTLKQLGWHYAYSGFYEISNKYHEQAFRLEGDSERYYFGLAHSAYLSGNQDAAIDFFKKAYAIDSNNIHTLGSLAQIYMRDREYSESLKYYQRFIERTKVLEQFEWREVFDNLGIAYVLLQKGFTEEANEYFEKVINFEKNVIKLERKEHLDQAYYRLAAIYAIRGNKDKAIENLRAFTREYNTGSECMIMKTDPWWDDLKDEPEFQQFIKEWEDKYQARHEQVRRWLEENNML
ncbi:MAG: helix-turn-helix domain-containing protein [Bacteroidota bacterium]